MRTSCQAKQYVAKLFHNSYILPKQWTSPWLLFLAKTRSLPCHRGSPSSPLSIFEEPSPTTNQYCQTLCTHGQDWDQHWLDTCNCLGKICISERNFCSLVKKKLDASKFSLTETISKFDIISFFDVVSEYSENIQRNKEMIKRPSDF